jgi:hypothetical protein
MQSKATTVEQYLAELPGDRREAIQKVRAVVRKNLGKGYEEGMQYGMIGYYVPHSIYPAGYHCDPKQPLPFAALASQKNYMSIYLTCVYGHPENEAWFRKAWAATGKKLDMGKSCVRFKRIEDLPLDVIGESIRRTPVDQLIAFYEAATAGRRPARATASSSAATSTTRKSAAKTPGKQTANSSARRPKPAKSKSVAKRKR